MHMMKNQSKSISANLSNQLRLLLCTLCLFASAHPAPAAEQVHHRVMLCEYGSTTHRLLELDAAGKIIWEHKVPSVAVCFQPLADGHVIYADFGTPNRIREIDRDQKVVWEYRPQCEQVVGLERLSNGNTLLAEEGPCRAVEVDAKGKIVSALSLKTTEKAAHHQLRCIHRLADGHILACHEGEGAVREYDAAGNVTWEYTGVTDVFEALRLPSGNTLIAAGTQKRLIEVTLDHKIVWQLTEKDAPDLNLTWITSIQILKNGHILAANFLRGQEGKGVHAFEVTHDPAKQIVWTFADHQMVKSLTMIRVLDDN
jgi:hypothetical protein